MLLKDAARYVRSKNAGPFWVTIDIFCETQEAFDIVVAAESLGNESIGRIYGLDPAAVRRFEMQSLKVLKLSFPRAVVQGAAHDADSHAGQYFVPLLDLQVGDGR